MAVQFQDRRVPVHVSHRDDTYQFRVGSVTMMFVTDSVAERATLGTFNSNFTLYLAQFYRSPSINDTPGMGARALCYALEYFVRNRLATQDTIVELLAAGGSCPDAVRQRVWAMSEDELQRVAKEQNLDVRPTDLESMREMVCHTLQNKKLTLYYETLGFRMLESRYSLANNMAQRLGTLQRRCAEMGNVDARDVIADADDMDSDADFVDDETEEAETEDNPEEAPIRLTSPGPPPCPKRRAVRGDTCAPDDYPGKRSLVDPRFTCCRKRYARQPAPRRPAPRQPAPRQPAPRQPAPRQPVPRQPAPRQPARRKMRKPCPWLMTRPDPLNQCPTTHVAERSRVDPEVVCCRSKRSRKPKE